MELKLFSNCVALNQEKDHREVCVIISGLDDSSYDDLGTLIKMEPGIKTKFDREPLTRP